MSIPIRIRHNWPRATLIVLSVIAILMECEELIQVILDTKDAHLDTQPSSSDTTTATTTTSSSPESHPIIASAITAIFFISIDLHRLLIAFSPSSSSTSSSLRPPASLTSSLFFTEAAFLIACLEVFIGSSLTLMTIGLSILKHPFFDTLSQSTLKRNQNRHPIYAEFHAFFLVVAPIFIVFAMKQMVNERRRDKMWEQQRKDLLQLEIQQVKWAIARGAGSGSDAGVGASPYTMAHILEEERHMALVRVDEDLRTWPRFVIGTYMLSVAVLSFFILVQKKNIFWKGFVLHSTWLLFCIYGLVTTIYRKSLRASKHLFWAYFILAQGVSFAIYSYIAFFKPTSPSSSLMHVNSTSGLDSFNTTSTTDTKVAKTKTIVIPLLLIDLLIHFVFRSFILYTIHQITKDLKKRESRKLFAQRIQENAPLILDLKH